MMGESRARSRLARRFGAAHDRLTTAGYVLAGAMLAIIAGSFCYEVVARYFFGAPTVWANAIAVYLLCPVIFLSMPELTRRRMHVAINLLQEKVSPVLARAMRTSVIVLSATACLLAAWFTADVTWGQFTKGILTISSLPVEKWLISVFIPYGMLSSGLYFLRQLLSGDPGRSEDAAGAGA